MTRLFAVTTVLLLLFSADAYAKKDFGTYTVNKAHLLFVYDGDTFFVNDPSCPPIFCERLGVRLYGLDTPEKHGKCEQEKALAAVAKKYLAQAIADGELIEVRHTRLEKYGRLMGELFIDDRDIAGELVQLGLAVPYFGKTKTKDWCEGETP